MSRNASPSPPIIIAAMLAAYNTTKRITQSSANAYRRAVTPAGRSSSNTPSGVSAATTVSNTFGALGIVSGFHDEGVGELVVEALPRVSEDEQVIDERVERDDADQPVDEIAQPEQAPKG